MAKHRTRQPIRLAVVDDSVFVRGALRRMFQDDQHIRVVGCAASGEELLANLDDWAPDIITLDLNMPGIGGMATLDRIHARKRIPVIVLSSCAGEQLAVTVEALSRPGVDYIDKRELSLADFSAMHRVLVERIEALSAAYRGPSTMSGAPADQPVEAPRMMFRAVVIGASTGGPQAIETILRELTTVPVPVVIAQHMPAGFTEAFSRRLDALVPFDVREARHGEFLTDGVVLIAPGGSDIRLRRDGERVITEIDYDGGPVLHRPSVDLLFASAAIAYGAEVVGVILSGMGSDGASGMAALRRAGAFTLGQDEPTSVVYGMPRAALAAGGVSEVLPLPRIASRLRTILSRR